MAFNWKKENSTLLENALIAEMDGCMPEILLKL